MSDVFDNINKIPPTFEKNIENEKQNQIKAFISKNYKNKESGKI